MRLIEVRPNGSFCLTKKFLDNSTPRYAILSHRWEDETQEVTFEDMHNGSGQGKAGYEKIVFCGEQAARHGLQYFWVDSCCIRKSNDAELSESLNSMYRWYRRAEKCYVYLSDVYTRKRKRGHENSQDTWEEAFRLSEWFTRGWTLQELLAPRSVEFFSKEGDRLGDKQSLERQIHEITGIPVSALRGSALSQFSTGQKFDWAKNRRTTREEDLAYSLLGIFEISMPVTYGEGRANAFRRLRKEIDDASKDKECLRHLYVTNPRVDKTRIEETKGGLIPDSYNWILENGDFKQWQNKQQSQLLWIKGDPGKGKTMLLCGIIDELKKSTAETHLLSFFFCQATDSRINNATAVLRGLLYLLIDQEPSLISHVQKQHDHAGKTLFEDTNAWVSLSEIFSNVLQDPSLRNTYMIVDALDECTADLPKLLDFIIQTSSTSTHVKWLVSSRNWPPVEERLDRAGNTARLCLELNAESVSVAVSNYIRHKVDQLVQEKNYDDKTRDTVLGYLSLNANDTFLWVALVCQNLRNIPRGRIRARLSSFPPGLDSLYDRMMKQICESADSELCKQILATVATVYKPIILTELTSLVEMLEELSDDEELLQEVIRLCGSFLTVRHGKIYLVHQSAKDYLLANASDTIFPSGMKDTHYQIFSKSLAVMSRTLRRDIYGLRAPGILIEQVGTPQADPLAASRYSCIYWVDHLHDWHFDSHSNHRADLQDGGTVDVFIRKKYLYWLEAISLCKSVPKGVLVMGKLEALIRGRANASALAELVGDARRFIMYYKQAIEISPLQVYSSALIFSPADSLIRRHFRGEEPKWITIKPSTTVGEKWSASLQTLEGHRGYVNSVAFSTNSAWLASASSDRAVRIWDAGSGECLQRLEGHSGSVNSVAFSHDSTQLASASYDRTVRIWHTSSGECLQRLEGHSGSVNSVAFSHDSTQLASASDDRTVRIWHTSSGECLQRLEGHSYSVNSVAFSHDSTQLASASGDLTVRIWHTSSGECLQTLKGHWNYVLSVAFSHNSTRLASAAQDGTVRIWDFGSGECIQTLESHRNSILSVAFSHDSTRLASALYDSTVQIWDGSSGECLQRLEGHSDSVKSVAFSHDSARLASASSDGTVRIWDAGSGGCLQMPESHKGYTYSVAFSHDSTQLASAIDSTVRIWDAGSGECLQMLEGHISNVYSVAFSHDSTRLASASFDSTVRIWDVGSGKCLQTLEGHRSYVYSVAFSHDSTQLASASIDDTVRIWDAGSGECLQRLEGHSGSVNSVAFSHDSARLASGSSDGMVRIWDAGSGECLQTLKAYRDGYRGSVHSVAFSHDSTRLASASIDRMVRIWDTGNGGCLQTLSTGRSLFHVSFDSTGSYLHTDIGTIALDKSSSSSNIAPDEMDSQSPRYQGVALSSDGAWITYNSKNLVWLPPEYRPSRSAVSGRTVGIGVQTGRVWVCSLQVVGFEHG